MRTVRTAAGPWNVGLAALVVATLLGLAGGCKKHPGGKPDVTESEDALRRAWAFEPAGAISFLDPIDGYSQVLGRYVHEGLAGIDPRSGRVIPALATRLDLSPDGLKVRATLRPDVLFHDGGKLVVDDVLATFAAIRDPQLPAATMRRELTDLESVNRVGAMEIEFVWARPNARALRVLADVVILPKRFVDAGLGGLAARRGAPGTGPFKIAEWKSGAIRIERHVHYWGKRPQLREAVFRIIPSATEQLKAFRAGRLDIVSIPSATYEAQSTVLAKDPKARVVRYPRSRYDELLFNTKKGYFAKVEARRAVARAIDRDTVIQSVFHSTFTPITGPVLPGQGTFTGLGPPPAVDREAVAKALTELGPPLAPLVLRAARHGGAGLPVADALKGQLDALGLSTRVEMSRDIDALIPLLKEGDFDLALWQDQASFDLDPGEVWHSDGRENFTGLSDKAVDVLIDRARRTIDFDARGALFEELAPLLETSVPVVWLWRYGAVVLISRDVEGAQPSVLAGLDDIRGWNIRR